MSTVLHSTPSLVLQGRFNNYYLSMAKKDKYEEKKKELASKGMPDPRVKKNVTEGDRKAELPCKDCGSKKHKTSEHKREEK